MVINNFFKYNILKNIKYFLANILSRLSKIINGKFSYGILVKCNNYPLIVESTDMGFGGQVRRTGKYGQDEISRIKKLINKMSPNGIILFDDYPTVKGASKAVDELLFDNKNLKI